MAFARVVLAKVVGACLRGAQVVRSLVGRYFVCTMEGEDNQRKEFLVRVTLTFTLGLAVLCFGIALHDAGVYGDGYNGVPPGIVAGIVGVLVGLLVVLRRGWLRVASAGLFLLYLVPSLYSSAHWGVDLPQALLSDAFLIVMASVLFGTRAAFALSIAISALLFVFARLSARGVLHPDRYWRSNSFDPFDGTVIAVTLGCIAVLCWLAHREIDRSLERARRSERLLREERDQLELRVAERSKELQRLQLEKAAQVQRFAELGRVAAGFFHDLASPLTAMSLNLELLRDQDSAAGGAAQASLARALSVATRLEAFLRGARRHIRAEEALGEFVPADVLSAVVDIVSYRARQVGVRVACANDAALRLYGDPVKFHQLAANLIVNAIDAYEDTGRDTDARVVAVALAGSDGGVILTVRDNGQGMAPGVRERIWEPFFTTKAPERGMGIGLTTCKDIAEQQFGGTIACDSALGKGTAFTVTLPHHGGRDHAAAREALAVAG